MKTQHFITICFIMIFFSSVSGLCFRQKCVTGGQNGCRRHMTRYPMSEKQCCSLSSATGYARKLKRIGPGCYECKTCDEIMGRVNGNWGEWSSWSQCTFTCGIGNQQRHRICNSPPPSNNGETCKGSNSEFANCKIIDCPIHGGWSLWSDWSQCSATCGKSEKTRTRICNNPFPQHGGHDCIGQDFEKNACIVGECPIDGRWTDWSDWSQCSKTCGDGTMTRSRSCTNPAPKHNGKSCTGTGNEMKQCKLLFCPIDGRWTDWSEWSQCSKTCNNGTMTRNRSCTNPAPQHNGKSCIGNETEKQPCVLSFCPIDGGWTDWSDWSQCSHTCGNGTILRSRSCTNPAPQNNGKSCIGNAIESENCMLSICPIDGGWTDWSDWSECSETCGNGTITRNRSCTNPAPLHGGTCPGNALETKDCFLNYCPIDGEWSDWSNWSICIFPNCQEPENIGLQIRSRTCTNPAPDHFGENCVGKMVDFKLCAEDENCPKPGGWGEWEDWNCEISKAIRKRYCINPPPKNFGPDCFGSNEEIVQTDNAIMYCDICRQFCENINGVWNPMI